MPSNNGRDEMKKLSPFYLALAGLLLPAQGCLGVVTPDGADSRDGSPTPSVSPELASEEDKADLGDLYDQREVDQTYDHGSTGDSNGAAGLSADEERLSAAEEEWGDD